VQAVTVVGAQAVYLRTGGADVALAEARKTVISRLILESCAAIRGSRWPWSGRVSTQTPSPVSRAPG
jgi:hypothetical protein